MTRRYCPVCWQPVGHPTTNGNTADHFDSAGRDICPMSGNPYTLTGYGHRNWTLVREYERPTDEHPDMTAADSIGHARIDRFERLLAS